MRFELSIRTENAAFADGNRDLELVRILRELADKMERGEHPHKLLDINGNTVGAVKYK